MSIVIRYVGIRSKYIKNRNVWRKVYSSQKRKPNEETFTDPVTGETYQLDLNKTIRNRDSYLLDNYELQVVLANGEYEETTQIVNNEDTLNFSLSTTFSGDPIITLEAEPAANEPDVDVHGLSFSGNPPNLNIGLSAPFSGTIRVRAVYSETYPATVTSAESGSFVINASLEPVANTSSFAFSYQDPELTSPTLVIHQSPWDNNSNNDVSVQELNTSLTVDQATGSLSAPMNNVIHWIVAYL